MKCEFLQRFPNRDISSLSRDELLKLFAIYAVPKARRNAISTDVEMTPVNNTLVIKENEHKRSRHQMISAPTVDSVTNACKKIRLINNTTTNQKRSHQSPLVRVGWRKRKKHRIINHIFGGPLFLAISLAIKAKLVLCSINCWNQKNNSRILRMLKLSMTKHLLLS